MSTSLPVQQEAEDTKTHSVPVVAPLVNIFENKEEILLQAEMPGVHKDAIEINLEDGKLSIQAKRHFTMAGAARFEEFADVEYQRVFSVPQGIETQKVDAELTDGVLCLHLPKSEAVKPRTIKIKQG